MLQHTSIGIIGGEQLGKMLIETFTKCHLKSLPI